MRRGEEDIAIEMIKGKKENKLAEIKLIMKAEVETDQTDHNNTV